MTAHLTPEAILKHEQTLIIVDRAAGAATGTGIDMKGAEGIIVQVPHDAIGTSLTIKLTHADTLGGSYTDALLDDGVSVLEVALPLAAGVGLIRVRGSRLKRFVKVVATIVGTNVIYSIESWLYGLDRQPADANGIAGYDLLV